ncbi:CoA transferase [Protaetiibacter intestinalis]|uniref:Acyl-CoA transferase n=1 Tax=Protaetiibacter intestinalis TaxID=2419774 RepID=A0A387B9E9_9MICO|nr:CoA transferase [Protaetiibacter intestinalis]AYF98388.1 acyl-CoA transferase [Protaetiibacter intestinalis]
MAGSADAQLRERMGAALGLDVAAVNVAGRGTLESAYPVSDLAAASVAAVGAGVTALLDALGLGRPPATVRRELADAWFRAGVRPVGWIAPTPWDPIAGDYRAADGWIRLHTNAPAHRQAALRVLGVDADRESVARAVAIWHADELEADVVAEGGCAAAMRTPEEWRRHPQGAAVAAEPLVAREPTDASEAVSRWRPTVDRPLAGLYVLDLTRVLAGPVATRTLAGLGAEVLRIDPSGWDEPALAHEVTIGKRTGRLDARDPEGLGRLLRLLGQADVVVHGYRRDALERLGAGASARRAARPGLVDVSLDAYGHSGPWAARRGFDSLVQMSSGIADAGMRSAAAEVPVPLPVQALDQATGYLMAAAVLAGLRDRVVDGVGSEARLSLARTAVELEAGRGLPRATRAAVPGPEDGTLLQTGWGPVRVLPAPLELPGVRIGWDRAPRAIGSDNPTW